MNNEVEARLLAALIVLLERSGGKISFTEDELDEATGHVVLTEADAAGFSYLHLLPDFVKLGDERKERAEAEAKALADKAMADMLKHIRKLPASPAIGTGTITGNTNWKYDLSDPASSTTSDTGRFSKDLEFEMKLSPTSKNQWKQMYDDWKKLTSTGSFGFGRKEKKRG